MHRLDQIRTSGFNPQIEEDAPGWGILRGAADVRRVPLEAQRVAADEAAAEAAAEANQAAEAIRQVEAFERE